MKDFFVIVLSYLLGCVNTGYYYTRFFYKQDIRTMGTEVTGATNVGRLAGKKGFGITFAGDFLKGVAAMYLCRFLQVSGTVVLLCVFAVVAGHIFPIQLQFKGGKGFATTLGALLMVDIKSVIIALVITGVILIFIKQRTISALMALMILPLVLWAMDYAWAYVLLFIALDGIFLYAFRDNIRKFREDWREQRKG